MTHDTGALRAVFHDQFGPGGPLRIARAPGRVNLIGEHVDYAGLPVLPIAIRQAVGILFRPTDTRVRVATMEPGHAPAGFDVGSDIPSAETGDWSNYVRAAVQTVARRLHRDGITAVGWDGLVVSDLPQAAGLSSSSALVVAAALATLDAAGTAVPTLELATLLARGERYVGTASGGMDQAVSLGGRPGHALRIDFEPLRIEPVPVPDAWSFVVAHSLERSEKSGAARQAYNLRGRQIREALDRLAREAGLDVARPGYPGLLEGYDVQDLVHAAREVLDAERLARFRHVVTEAHRVEEAVAAMRAGDMARFGTLMDASHASLRDDYEVSTPALNQLVSLAKQAGARGARLTGAGFGGCAVCLCDEEEADAVMEALREGFFRGRGVADPTAAGALFVAEASGGGGVAEV